MTTTSCFIATALSANYLCGSFSKMQATSNVILQPITLVMVNTSASCAGLCRVNPECSFYYPLTRAQEQNCTLGKFDSRVDVNFTNWGVMETVMKVSGGSENVDVALSYELDKSELTASSLTKFNWGSSPQNCHASNVLNGIIDSEHPTVVYCGLTADNNWLQVDMATTFRVIIAKRPTLGQRISGLSLRVTNSTAAGQPTPLSTGTFCGSLPTFSADSEVPEMQEIGCNDDQTIGRYVQLYLTFNGPFDMGEVYIHVKDTIMSSRDNNNLCPTVPLYDTTNFKWKLSNTYNECQSLCSALSPCLHFGYVSSVNLCLLAKMCFSFLEGNSGLIQKGQIT